MLAITCIKINIREIEMFQLYNFQLQTALGAQKKCKNAKIIKIVIKIYRFRSIVKALGKGVRGEMPFKFWLQEHLLSALYDLFGAWHGKKQPQHKRDIREDFAKFFLKRWRDFFFRKTDLIAATFLIQKSSKLELSLQFFDRLKILADFCINWSTSELNTQVNPTTCLGDTGCWIQQVTAPTLVVTCWIHQCASILPSTCTGRGARCLSSSSRVSCICFIIKHNVILHLIPEATNNRISFC